MEKLITPMDKSRPPEATSSRVLPESIDTGNKGARFGIDVCALPADVSVSLIEQKRLADEEIAASAETAQKLLQDGERLEAAKLDREARLERQKVLKEERTKGEEVAGVYARATAYADLGSRVFATMFGHDNPETVQALVKSELLDSYQLLMLNDENYKNTDADPGDFLMSSCIPIPSVNLVEEEEGQDWISFPQLIAGYNKLASMCGFRDADVESDMYAGRSSDWYNSAFPPLKLSSLGRTITGWDPAEFQVTIDTDTPLEGVLFDPKQHAEDSSLHNQQLYLKSVAKDGKITNDATVVRSPTLAMYILHDAMSIYNSTIEHPIVVPGDLPRMDENNFVRLAQYDRGVYGEDRRRRGADVHIDGRRLTLDSSPEDQKGSHVHKVVSNSVRAVLSAHGQ